MFSKLIAVATAALIVVACVAGARVPEAAAQPERAYSCFWLSNRGEGWVRMPQLRTEQQCFEMDSCDGGLGHSIGGCYMWSTAADAPRRPWTVAPAETYACYWLSNEGEGWVERPDLATERQCFEMDSCDGGLGYSGGGCYMWSTAADAPRRPWSNQPPRKR